MRELRRRHPAEAFRKDNTPWADLCYQFRVAREGVQLVEVQALAGRKDAQSDPHATMEALERAAERPPVDAALDRDAVRHCTCFRLLSVRDLRVRRFTLNNFEYGFGYSYDDYGRSGAEGGDNVVGTKERPFTEHPTRHVVQLLEDC